MAVAIQQLFEPFYGFDVALLYSRFGPFIDFLLFSVLFISLAQVTIGRHFKHKGIAVALGFILATALAIAEPIIGFNIRSLGPLAAVTVILFVGFFVYRFLRHFGVDKLGAASLAVVIMYASLLLYTPNFIGWINQNFPFAGAVLIIVFIIAVYKVIARFTGKSVDLPAAHSPPEPPMARKLAAETETVKYALRGLTKKASKGSKEIIDDLATTIRMLETDGNNTDTRAEARRRLNGIAPKRHDLVAQVERIRALIEDIRTFGLRYFKHLKSLPAEEQRAQKKLIVHELEKINAVEELRRFRQTAKKYQQFFDHSLRQALGHLNSDNVNGAITSLTQCLKAEKSAHKTFKKMRTFEDVLLRITKQELRSS